MIAIDPVEDRHVKRRRRRAFLAKAVNMDVVVIGAIIRQAMDHIRIAVVSEDHRLVGWKYPVEVLVGKPVRMLLARLQRHEVDNVDHPDAEIGKSLAQKSNGGQRLQRRDITSARHHHVRSPGFSRSGPRPDTDASGAVRLRLSHRQPLRPRLLARNDDVDPVVGSKTMIGDPEETIGIWRKIDTNDVSILVGDEIDKARILMAETIVVLSPDVRAEQIVE
jgi:hypothetical protein